VTIESLLEQSNQNLDRFVGVGRLVVTAADEAVLGFCGYYFITCKCQSRRSQTWGKIWLKIFPYSELSVIDERAVVKSWS
jgi:hypothetical protein